ncbi:cache domain-containing protein [Iningainema tapete]|uniref:PDC sensor domain-containing protein n=1 Tax=Iningainema tapete BLCC-T55 TaxID=2748662 RepID=A0A8J6XR01_9CYAN|nr:cache domain-containing protein [Iningainema tapete]MBD2776725.1 PDC sensor domain-containing protein [Iningainema tapete BLCC-T55]
MSKKITAKNRAEIETALEELAKNFAPNPANIDSIFCKLINYLNHQPLIFGAAFAFSPKIFKMSPFVYRGDNGMEYKDIAQSIDYTTAIWYEVPVNQKKALWSVPYFDFGRSGESLLLTTYSIPLFQDGDQSLIGVLTSDLMLAKIIEPISVCEPVLH